MVRIAAIFLAAASLAGAFALGQNATETREQPLLRGKHADDTDRAVLEALLLSVASDKDFPAPLADDKPVVVLHLRNPDTVEEIVNTSLLIQDTGGKVMPKDAWDDLIRRNVVHRQPKSRQILYDGLQFDPKIVVGDAHPEPKPPLQGKTFQDVFPNARGWVSAWVPGYSKDHKTAVVRAQVGPGKVATLTAILKQQNGAWTVVWRRYSVYT